MTYHEAIVYAWRRSMRDDIAVCITRSKKGILTYRHTKAAPGIYIDNIPDELGQDPNPTPISMQEINEALAIVAGITHDTRGGDCSGV